MSGILNAIGLGGNKDNSSNTTNSSSNSSNSTMHSNSTTSGRPNTMSSTTVPATTTTSSYQSGGVNTTGYDNTSTANTTGSRNTDRTSTMNTGADDAMTRSEERLHVGKESVEAGKARVHKYVTSEHVEKEVPLQKESVVLEREPITDANRDRAYAGPEIKEAEYEVNLREEVPVVSKETVAKERVRLAKNVEQTTESVGGDIRKEHIEYGATPGVEINKTTSAGTRTGTSTTTAGPNRTDMNLQGVKTTNPTYTA